MEIELFYILQDQLSADLYNFASKEGDYARYYVMVSPPRSVHYNCMFGDAALMPASLYMPKVCA